MFDLLRHGKATAQHALPTSCLLPQLNRDWVVLNIWLQLKKHMPGDEVLKAHMEEQPFLDKMRDITCLGCVYKECHLNFDYKEVSI